MKYNPFQHFKIRSDKSKVSELEIKYGLKLPPLFKVFNETFIINSFEQPNRDGFWIQYPNENVDFDAFRMDLEFAIKFYLSDYAHNTILNGFLPFASSGIHHFGICIGLNDDYKDKVCIHIESGESQVTVINENIFEFIQDLIYYNHQTDKTYANRVE